MSRVWEDSVIPKVDYNTITNADCNSIQVKKKKKKSSETVPMDSNFQTAGKQQRSALIIKANQIIFFYLFGLVFMLFFCLFFVCFVFV